MPSESRPLSPRQAVGLLQLLHGQKRLSFPEGITKMESWKGCGLITRQAGLTSTGHVDISGLQMSMQRYAANEKARWDTAHSPLPTQESPGLKASVCSYEPYGICPH